MDREPVELKVKIGPKELFSFLFRHTYTTPSGIFGLCVSLTAFLLLILGYAKGDDFRMIVLLVLGLLFTVINPIMLYMRAKNQALTNPVYKNELCYTLDESGITLEVGEAKETVAWDKIRRWKRTRVVHILYTTKIHAILLPFSCMKGKEKEVEGWLLAMVRGK
ncbi:MAG: YcxB family protein [Lachnospiraceae bacterium]|nr:YcxB family protein [Lachnospiraceae bacterium]